MAFWIFGKKEKKNSQYSLSVDIHSHTLPAIDDGSQSLQESIDMLKEFIDVGYKKIICTPHIMVDAYKNSPTKVRETLAFLREEALKEGLNIQIEAAAEYYLDDGFLEHLKSGDLLTFGDNYLLFETSYMDKPINMEDFIFEIQSSGYTPVLAHPERYRYIKDLDKEYSRLKDLGVLFQVNLNSLIGGYGKDAKRKAEYLVKSGYISFLGSDAHGLRHIEGVKKAKNLDIFDSIFQKNKILNDTL